MDDLFHAINAGKVGGPSMPLIAAGVTAANPTGTPNVAPLGQGQAATLVKFDPSNQDGGQIRHAPRVLTATVVASQDGSSIGIAAPLVALVTWGSGNGGRVVAEVDIPSANGVGGNAGGLILSVLGDYLQIDARNDANVTPSPGDDPIGNPAAKVFGSASIGEGPRGGTEPVTRTIYGVNSAAGGLAPTDFVSIPIPPFARAFRVFRHSADQSVQVRVLATPPATFTVDGPYNLAANAPSPRIALLGGASFVEVVNTGAANLNVVGLIFELGL